MQLYDGGRDTRYMRLPPDLTRSCGRCNCLVCMGKDGLWDTLAIGLDTYQTPPYSTWLVHYPRLEQDWLQIVDATPAEERIITNRLKEIAAHLEKQHDEARQKS